MTTGGQQIGESEAGVGECEKWGAPHLVGSDPIPRKGLLVSEIQTHLSVRYLLHQQTLDVFIGGLGIDEGTAFLVLRKTGNLNVELCRKLVENFVGNCFWF